MNLGICNPIWVPNGFLDQDFAAICDDLISLGIKWIRHDFLWSVIQPTSSTWNWSNYDRFVTIANSKNLRILPIINYSNPWANGLQGQYTPPTNDSDFALFAASIASRYAAQGVSSYEIWNEPNNANNWTGDVPSFARLLQSAYTAIKAVQPNSTIILGGLAPMSDDGTNVSPQTFLSKIYQTIGNKYFDAVAYHPYGWNMTQLNSIKQVMAENGDAAKPLWFTEYGEPTNGTTGQDFVSEDTQANLIVGKMNSFNTLAQMLFIYNYQDSSSAQPDREGYFGIRRSSGTPKPSYGAVLNN